MNETQETLLTMERAAAYVNSLSGGGRGPHFIIILLWIRIGRLDPSGQRIYLRSYRIGDQQYTSRADIDAFLAALNDKRSQSDHSTSPAQSSAVKDELRND